MADDEKKPVENADQLSDLLDSALKDFKQPEAKPRTTDDELDEIMNMQDQKAAQKAASDFQQMLSQMVQVQEESLKRAEENGGAAEGQMDPNDPEAKAMMDALKQLMDCSSTVANAGSPEEFMAGLDMLRSPDSPMEPFMQMIMQTLASKEVMYPPLKEIYDNFPNYMKEHESELDEETKARYNKQYEVLGRICTEFESQPEMPTVAPEDVATTPEAGSQPPLDEAASSQEQQQPIMDEHFERLGKMLVELQACGYPPKELVGNLPEGWTFGDSGMPQVQDPSAAAEACTIM